MKAVIVGIVVAVVGLCAAVQSQDIEQTVTGFYYPTGVYVDENTNSYAKWLAYGEEYGGCDCYHIGWDIVAGLWDPVFAIADGEVLSVSQNDWGGDETGNNVGLLIRHTLQDGSEFVAVYGHVRSDLLPGDEVVRGQQIAIIGPWDPVHLHFGIHPGGSLPPDPFGALPGLPDPPYNGWVNPIDWIVQNNPGRFFQATLANQTPEYPSGQDYYSVIPGEILDVSFTFDNVGTRYWTNRTEDPHYVELQSVYADCDDPCVPWSDGLPSELAYYWIDDINHVGIVSTEGDPGLVDPNGGQGLYAFQIRAPDEPGDYYLYVALYRPRTGEHFSGAGPTLHIRVTGTEISGTLPVALPADEGPYLVTGNISVAAGQSVTIEAGCEFIFRGHYKLIVNADATLRAVGTETDSIIFTAQDHEVGWYGIRFTDANSASELAYCRIEYGRTANSSGQWDSQGGGILCLRSNPTIRNCLIQQCKSLGYPNSYGGGIYVGLASPEIIENKIVACSTLGVGGGICLYSSGLVLISGNTFIQNNAKSGGGVGMYYSSASFLGNNFNDNHAEQGGAIQGWSLGATEIRDNVITGNTAGFGGGLCLEQVTLDISGNLIDGNVATRVSSNCTGGGVCLYSACSGVMHDNTISNNSMTGYGTIAGGGGVYISSNQIEIYNNDIFGNYSRYTGGAFYIRDGASPSIHNNQIHENSSGTSAAIDVLASNPVITNNSVYGNSRGKGVINQSTSPIIDATNNWWGDDSGPYHPVTNPDGLGNSVSDNVNYSPWLVYTPDITELILETTGWIPEQYYPRFTSGGHINSTATDRITFLFEEVFLKVHTMLNWLGSPGSSSLHPLSTSTASDGEFKLTIYRPDSTLVGEWQSAASPMEVEFVPDTVGEWIFEVTAINVPYDEYPYALVAGTITAGSISGNVLVEGILGVSHVAVDVLDSVGTCVLMTETDGSGSFSTGQLMPGIYTVSILPPLGYTTDTDQVAVEVVPGSEVPIAFDLTKLDIVPDQQPAWFWRHECNEVVYGDSTGTLPGDSLCTYEALLRQHFTQHRSHPILSVTSGNGSDCLGHLETLAQTFNARVRYYGSVNDRGHTAFTAQKLGSDYFVPLQTQAQQQLLALMLNVASGRLDQFAAASDDSATVSQAITYCDSLIRTTYSNCPESSNPSVCHTLARDIALAINTGQVIGSGTIPLDIPQYSYKPEQEDIVPYGFSLSQNYPNPFNPVTTISYSLPGAMHVTLDIYNVIGQHVATLIDGEQTAGEHRLIWDAGQYASGIYFYRLTAGTSVETKKMLLLK